MHLPVLNPHLEAAVPNTGRCPGRALLRDHVPVSPDYIGRNQPLPDEREGENIAAEAWQIFYL